VEGSPFWLHQLAGHRQAAADLVAGEVAVEEAGFLRVAHDLIREWVAASVPPEASSGWRSDH
jgi:hypothetical protein